jgi:hypothetical protein
MNREDYKVMPVGTTSTGISVSDVEIRYNATYMGDFCLITKGDSWGDSTVAVFWQPNPDTTKGHSHYFGMFVRDGTVYITNASSAFRDPIVGIVADNGEVIFSRSRHDFRSSSDRTVSIDGGRDYTRLIGNIHNPTVHLVPDGPVLKIVTLPDTQ